jgi:hypothetical protein
MKRQKHAAMTKIDLLRQASFLHDVLQRCFNFVTKQFKIFISSCSALSLLSTNKINNPMQEKRMYLKKNLYAAN